MVDLVAALATGAVGAFALVRSDVGDTLPGVAIAISLVPPLAVVGLTWEAGRPTRRAGLTGLETGAQTTVRARYPVLAIVVLIVVVTMPLVASGRRFRTSTLTTHSVSTIASDWAHAADWEITTVEFRDGAVVVRASGPKPVPDAQELREMLDDRGEDGPTSGWSWCRSGATNYPGARPPGRVGRPPSRCPCP